MRVRVCGAAREDVERFATEVGVSKVDVGAGGCASFEAPSDVKVDKTADRVRVCVPGGVGGENRCLTVDRARRRPRGLSGFPRLRGRWFWASELLIVAGAVLVGTALNRKAGASRDGA